MQYMISFHAEVLMTCFNCTFSDETLEEEALQDLVPCSESPPEEQASHQKEQEAWDVEDVELEFFDINSLTEQREEAEPKPEPLSNQTSCSNCLPSNQGSLIDAEERALLNLLKFDNRGPRGSRWNAPGASRRYVSVVEWPRRGDDKDKHKERIKKRARLEKTSSMLERLQSCLTRAEAHKAAAASLDSAKALEGDCSLKSHLVLQALYTVLCFRISFSNARPFCLHLSPHP